MNRGPRVTRPEDTVVANQSKKKLKVLLRLGKYMAHFKWGYLAAVALSVCSNLLSLIGPKLSGEAIDAIGTQPGQADFEKIALYCTMMLGAYLLSSVMAYTLQVVMINLSRGIVRKMREDIFAKLMRMKVGYFDVNQTGDIISRISYDIDTINATLSTDLVQIASSLVTVIGSLVMMISISPTLCLVFAVTVPMSILVSTKMANKFRPLFRARSGKLGELNGYAEECLSGQKTVRAYSAEPSMIDRFAVKNKSAADDRTHYMLPPAEAALCSIYRDEILTEADLPKKLFAYTPCFRREAGSHRADERGMVRGHQFNKVEMFQFCKPEDSDAAFDELVTKAEKLVEGLGFHFRTVKLAAGDCSASMARTYDIEILIPSMDGYKEVSSVSNARDYQARRGNIRFRREETGKPEFVHTLNGSGLATSRIFPALVEQNQRADGSIVVPECLRKYLGGLEVIEKK